MTETLLCPYYGEDESYGVLGCDDITPHDVSLIVRCCAGPFRRCPKYPFPVAA